ncbi:MAG: tetratricopeptide (TPR) repeat protein [Crocinitomix sp.]|jgi:tetratricopeptide (TPR) repeat protein
MLNDEPVRAIYLVKFYTKFFKHDQYTILTSAFIYLRLDLFDIYDKQLPYVAKIYKDHINYYILKGVEFQRKNDYEKAISILNEGIELTGDSADAYNNRGYYSLLLGDFENALHDFNKAIEINAKLYFAYNNRGLAKIKLNDESGINDIRKSLKGFENNAMGYKNLALWEFHFGDKSRIPKILAKCKRRAYYVDIKEEVAELEELLI